MPLSIATVVVGAFQIGGALRPSTRAQANEDERMQAIAKGAVDFLRKPFSEDALFNAIQAAPNR
jgi:hypothetical protein